jgi:hypothetical protein
VNVWLALVPVVVGAAIGLVPAYLLERRRERSALAVRWDMSLYQLCAEFTVSVRHMIAEAEQTGATSDAMMRRQRQEQLDEHRVRLRTLQEQIRLLGNSELQTSARLVLHHAYAVRTVSLGGADPRAEDYPGTDPRERLNTSIRGFYVAARKQLRVEHPLDVSPDEVIPERPLPPPG